MAGEAPLPGTAFHVRGASPRMLSTRYNDMKRMRTKFTKRDWELLPEGFPAQLIEGQLVRDEAPTYGHQLVAARIRYLLFQLLGPDRVPDSPADVLVDDTTILEPDIVVLAGPGDPASSYVGIPLLVVEVLSPSTRERDRGVKAALLLGLGVGEVWLVDPEARTIEVRTPDGAQTFTGSAPARSEVLPGFELIPDLLYVPPR